ncbi:hypothetical protein PT974_08663 [Cladobotryum mycophilum]|uniref:Uncharacterized protein n=1 Tax=Cladobotryum mycophilum TaxID=491253 RepID=A0ABR0SF40_9HYPO
MALRYLSFNIKALLRTKARAISHAKTHLVSPPSLSSHTLRAAEKSAGWRLGLTTDYQKLAQSPTTEGYSGVDPAKRSTITFSQWSSKLLDRPQVESSPSPAHFFTLTNERTKRRVIDPVWSCP